MDPISEFPGARQPTEESTAAADGLGGGERLVPTVDKSAAMPGAMAGATGFSKVDAGVVDAVPESGAEKPVVLEEQAALLETLEGVVGHAVWQLSPSVVPPAAEEDEVEGIEHEKS